MKPPPELEYHSKMLLRQQQITVRSDSTLVDVFGLLCNTVSKLSDKLEVLTKRQVRLEASGGSGSSGNSGSSKGSGGGKDYLIELNSKSFFGLGTTSDVPQYLRLPETKEVGNLMLDQQNIIDGIKSFWAARLNAKHGEKFHDTLTKVLKSIARDEFNDESELIAVGYSFCAGLQNIDRPEVTEFAAILRGEMDEKVHMQHLMAMRSLEAALESMDSRSHGGVCHGKITMQEYGEALRSAFPAKPVDRIAKLMQRLKDVLKGGDGMVVYAQITEMGSEMEVALFQQHLQEREDFMAEIIGSLMSEATAGTGLVSFAGVVRAVRRVDPDNTIKGIQSMVPTINLGSVDRIAVVIDGLKHGVLTRVSCKPSPEAWTAVSKIRKQIKSRLNSKGEPLFASDVAEDVFVRYKNDPPANLKAKLKLEPAVDEMSLGVVIAECCVLNSKADYLDLETAMEKLLDDIGFESYLSALHTGKSIPQVRVTQNTVVEEFVAQVQEYLIDNLVGAEWVCRKLREDAGLVPWDEVHES